MILEYHLETDFMRFRVIVMGSMPFQLMTNGVFASDL
jgi:hypothetical protein